MALTKTDNANTTFVDCFVLVVIVGDLNNDGIVDYRDINPICPFRQNPARSKLEPNCDIIEDGIIDYRDINVPSRNYEKTNP